MNIDDLLPFYALDALTDEERIFVEEYLVEHPEMLAELDEMKADLSELPLSIEPIVPSADVKSALMQRVASHPRAQAEPTATTPPTQQSKCQSFWERIGLSSPWPAATALGFALAAIMLLYALNVRGNLQTLNDEIVGLETSVTQLEDDNRALQSSIAQLEDDNAALAVVAAEAETLRSDIVALEATVAELQSTNETLSTINDELQRQLEQDEMLLAIYTSPNLQTAEIGSTDANSDAGGLLVVDPSSEMGVLNLHGLDALSAESTYQFWLINLEDEAFVSAGVFEADNTGRSRYVFDVASLDPYNAIGVSIEPDGGSEQPTLENVVMFAELDG